VKKEQPGWWFSWLPGTLHAMFCRSFREGALNVDTKILNKEHSACGVPFILPLLT
jgi:hypothetical protein